MNSEAANPLRIALFASGNGSNVERIAHFFKDSSLAQASIVFTNNPKAGVLTRAHQLGIPSVTLSRNEYSSGNHLNQALSEANIDFIVLAGWLKQIPDELKRLGHLEVLFLARNKISILPVWVGGLGHLRRLDLTYNRITPRELSLLKMKMPRCTITP